jgi:hypothetical protein
MALVRCEECGIQHAGTGTYTREYVRSVVPVEYPETALVCGRANCHHPGMIWLEQEESEAFDAGERVFRLQTGTVKVRAL